MNWTLGPAQAEDIPALESLIPLSARSLLKPHYSTAQIEAALGPVFGVDRQLIQDGTYYMARHQGGIIGCGGWSKRAALFGGNSGARAGEDRELNPLHEPARIRAFFVHPDWTRRGIGRKILAASERAAVAASFQKAELSATLGGEPLYAACGYRVEERYEIKLRDGICLPVARMTKELRPEN
jgi:GNAT superfamily N-acetyltransferase